jgi:hypothetical protein
MEAMMMAAPQRSLQQRRAALEHANEIRSFRAQLKKDVKAGRTDVVLLLLSNEPKLQTMKVFELVKSAPRMGHYKTDRILRRLEISPSKTIGGMTERQRRELAARLPFLLPSSGRDNRCC